MKTDLTTKMTPVEIWIEMNIKRQLKLNKLAKLRVLGSFVLLSFLCLFSFCLFCLADAADVAENERMCGAPA